MSSGKPHILIAGGGIGGMCAAAALLRRGFEVDIFEQAGELREVGAGIQISPNGNRALDSVGAFDTLRKLSCQSESKEVRLWNTGKAWKLFDLGEAAVARYGYPYMTVYRPDLLTAVTEAVIRQNPKSIHLNSRAENFVEKDGKVTLTLEGGSFARARATSVDYAIMEKIGNIAVVEGSFSWSDIGSWDAVAQGLPRDADGNAIAGDGYVHNASNCLIHSRGRLTVASGVHGLAIITTADAVLVIPKAQSQEVKTIATEVAQRLGKAPAAAALPYAFPKPVANLSPGTFDFEVKPLVAPSGFREYDARWWFGHAGSPKPPEINLMGVTAIGLGLGTLLARRGKPLRVVTGHDYRSYSQAIKAALITGLMAAGCEVHDIGLAITPMAYFAQFALDIDAVAMVTASHNENGWTGIKMGCERPVTFGPGEMAELRGIVLAGAFAAASGGSYRFVPDFAARYMDDLTARPPFNRKLKVVVACGNGTAGAFAPRILEKLGADVIPVHTELDYSFPNYNPNPEDMAMLRHIASEVLAHGADAGLGFDGDGDRCGVVDNEGHEIFADKIGLLLARDLAARHANARFVVDVKSTSLFETDSVLKSTGAVTDYFKTGHSYIKRRVQDLQALAGFEKSGHFFFNAPVGRGYDDGMVTAIAILDMLVRNPGRAMADLYRGLPATWSSPTMSALCGDDVKYAVVDRVVRRIVALRENGEPIAGHAIAAINTINGIRVTTDDGTWGLVRASSNKPEIVVVVESPQSKDRLHTMFQAIDGLLRGHPEVGNYNQTL